MHVCVITCPGSFCVINIISDKLQLYRGTVVASPGNDATCHSNCLCLNLNQTELRAALLTFTCYLMLRALPRALRLRIKEREKESGPRTSSFKNALHLDDSETFCRALR
eukprot:1159647-Pelagomonas_calceolata.AAC.3